MEEPPDRKLHYDKFFFINRSKEGKLGYIRSCKAIDEQLARCGFFLIEETDFTKSPAEVLELYLRRDVIEKNFDDLKNGVDMKRLHCHSNETVEGKTFVAFLALIVRAYMQNKLGPMMRQNSFPFRKILLELEKIRCLSMTPNGKPAPLLVYSKEKWCGTAEKGPLFGRFDGFQIRPGFQGVNPTCV